MADLKISQLPVDTALTGPEKVPIVDNTNKVTTAAAIAALAAATNLAYDPATRLLSSSTGTDVTLPLAGATDPGLLTAAEKLLIASALQAGPIGSSGLTMTAGIVMREAGTGAPQVYPLGAGFSIVGGALTVTGGGGGGYPSLSMPTGFNVSGSGTASLAVTFATGYSLPTDARQSDWDAAFTQRRTWDGGDQHLNPATARTSLQLGSAAQAATSDFATAAQGALAATAVQPAALAGYQPVDSDLTAIAALSTTSYGRALLTLADAAAGRTALELGTAATTAASAYATAAQGALADTAVQPAALGGYQPLDSDLTAIAALATTTFGRSLLTQADAAAARSAIGAAAVGGGSLVYAVNNWITPQVGNPSNGGTATASRLYLTAFEVKRACTISDLGVQVITGVASSSLQLGVYAANSTTGLPTGLPLGTTGNITSASAQAVSGSVSTQFTLQPGVVYWIGINQDAAITIRSIGTGSFAGSIIGSATLSDVLGPSIARVISSQAFGTWPDLSSVATISSPGEVNRTPFVALRISALP
jgi:hypothetical protein